MIFKKIFSNLRINSPGDNNNYERKEILSNNKFSLGLKNKINEEKLSYFEDWIQQIKYHEKECFNQIDHEEIQNFCKSIGKLDDVSYLVLIGCSLFDKFGFEKDVVEEYKFIAEFMEIDHTNFHRKVQELKNLDIVEMKGRYARVIPEYMSLWLANYWWKHFSFEKQKELIESILITEKLRDSFCNQIKKLDFSRELKKAVKNFYKYSGLLEKEEVILSPVGSSLFCSFVEVNQEQTSKALYRVLKDLSHEELLNINGDTRRNLVRALEKLCYRKSVFKNSMKSLICLASAENEDWGNNATGIFKQMFGILLPGTEASLCQRIEVIDFITDFGNKKLAVTALESAITIDRSFSRSCGSERQGIDTELEDFNPTCQEIFDYCIKCIEKLTDIAMDDDITESDIAKNVIANNICGLVKTDLCVIETLDNTIRKIYSEQNFLWHKAMECISDIDLDSQYVPEGGKEIIEGWIELLTPKMLTDRIQHIVSIPPYNFEKDENGDNINITEKNAIELAKELSSDINKIIGLLGQLCCGEQRQAWTFGQELVLTSKEWELLFNETLSTMLHIKQPTISFLLGILNGIYELDEEKWNTCLDTICDIEELVGYYPDLIRTGNIRKRHLDNINRLIKSGDISVDRVYLLSYGRCLKNIDSDDMSEFITEFENISDKAAWIGLEILSMHCDDENWDDFENIFKNLLKNISLNCRISRHSLDLFHWHKNADQLLQRDNPELAGILLDKILKVHVDEENMCRGDLDHYTQKIMAVIMRRYAEQVLPIVSDLIRKVSSLQRYQLRHLFGSNISFDDERENRILDDVSENLLGDWCKHDPENAPIFIASTINTLSEKDDKCEFSEKAKFIFDNFSDNEQVLNSLYCNMSSFGGSGTMIPQYEKRIEAMESLSGHPNSNIQDWANECVEYLKERLDYQKQTEQERDIGVY